MPHFLPNHAPVFFENRSLSESKINLFLKATTAKHRQSYTSMWCFLVCCCITLKVYWTKMAQGVSKVLQHINLAQLAQQHSNGIWVCNIKRVK